MKAQREKLLTELLLVQTIAQSAALYSRREGGNPKKVTSRDFDNIVDMKLWLAEEISELETALAEEDFTAVIKETGDAYNVLLFTLRAVYTRYGIDLSTVAGWVMSSTLADISATSVKREGIQR
jgi:NTP pyrophosphatase (non-canonical NTP hydrolase)